MAREITAFSNPLVKRVRALRDKRLGCGDRILRIDLRGRNVAALHAHAFSAAQIECGDNDHARFSIGTNGPAGGPLYEACGRISRLS